MVELTLRPDILKLMVVDGKKSGEKNLYFLGIFPKLASVGGTQVWWVLGCKCFPRFKWRLDDLDTVQIVFFCFFLPLVNLVFNAGLGFYALAKGVFDILDFTHRISRIH